MLYVSASLSKWSASVIVGPIAKGRGPRLLAFGGNGVRPGPAVRSPIRAPSSDGENGNATARNSFRRLFEVDHDDQRRCLGFSILPLALFCCCTISLAPFFCCCNGDLRLGDQLNQFLIAILNAVERSEPLVPSAILPLYLSHDLGNGRHELQQKFLACAVEDHEGRHQTRLSSAVRPRQSAANRGGPAPWLEMGAIGGRPMPDFNHRRRARQSAGW